VCVCLSFNRISLETLVQWISNLTIVFLRARLSAVPNLTLFGWKMQKISLNTSLKEAHWLLPLATPPLTLQTEWAQRRTRDRGTKKADLLPESSRLFIWALKHTKLLKSHRQYFARAFCTSYLNSRTDEIQIIL